MFPALRIMKGAIETTYATEIIGIGNYKTSSYLVMDDFRG